MKRNIPAYVYKKTVKGRDYYYFQKDGLTVRVDPFSRDFLREYDRLLNEKPTAIGRRTWKALIKRYKGHTRFKALAPRTVRDYLPVLDFISERYGNLDPSAMKKFHIVDQQESLRGKFARDFVNVISVLLGLATEIGWREDNPAKDIRRKQTETKAPHIVWTDEAVAKFRAEAAPLPLLIFEIGLGTIQRPDDWTRINWEDFTGTEIRLTQSKTGLSLVLPCPATLISALEASRPKVRNIAGTPILRTGQRRMTYRRMAEIMLRERQRLGLSQFDLHALRYRGVQELAWAGCSDEEIMSISGHSTKSMVRLYAGKARQIMRARQANEKRKGLDVTVTNGNIHP